MILASERNFIPQMEILQTHRHQLCKEASASCLSRLFFWWINPLIDLGSRQFLQEGDLYDILDSEKILFNIEEFKKAHSFRKSKNFSNSFTRIFLFLNRKEFCISFFYNILSSILQFAGPLCLNQILLFLTSPDVPNYEGYIWASVMMVCFFGRTIFQQQAMHQINSVAQRIQGTLLGLIYEKLLSLACSAKKYQDSGKIMNLVNVDVFGVWNFIQFLLFGFSTPIILIISIILIILQLSWIGLIGIIILLIGFFLQNVMQKLGYKYRKEMLNQTDERSQAIHEFINGIKIIKYYGWEPMVLEKIARIRQKESSTILNQGILKGSTDVVSTFFPLIISVVVFAIYGVIYNDFSPAKAYTVLTLFNIIQVPLRIVGYLLTTFIAAKTGMFRIEHFYKSEEKEPSAAVFDDECLKKGELLIENGSFFWETEFSYKLNQEAIKKSSSQKKQKTYLKKEEIPMMYMPPIAILKNINFSAKKGEFIAIIGQVGSGKSSFAHALLGEMIKMEGKVLFNGSRAYVPQSAWLMNTTLRENILFFNEYNERKYQNVLNLCELMADIEQLPGGDLTEIGERGVNLSGGQKQRISLARAIYEDTDIYIIDDVLSSLDAHVGKEIYHNVMRGLLKTKTVIFITHALQYIKEADKILVFKNGEIVEQGDFATLSAGPPESEFRKLSAFHSNNKTPKAETEKNGVTRAQIPDKKIDEDKNKDNEKIKKGALMKMEERIFGSVPWRIYHVYMSSGGFFFTVLTIIMFVIAQVARFLNDWWLGSWASDQFETSLGVYIGIYLVFAIVGSLMVFVRCVFFFKFALKTSQKLQKNLMMAIFKAPMAWYDMTPIGRILSRTSKDQDNLDSNLPLTMQFCIVNILMIIGAIFISGIITPLFFILIFVSVIVYGYLIKKYLRCSREIKRIELNSRGPVNSYFSETSNGLYVIRAFQKQKLFLDKFMEKAENYTRAVQNNMYTARWVGLRTDFFGTVLIAAAAYFGVLSRDYNYNSNPSLIGFSITWVLLISQMLSFAIRLTADTENLMSSVQKINDYIENTPQEPDFNFPQPKSAVWPTKGVIKAENLFYKYRENLDYVLKDVSFETNPHEKIGVIGRTGSGKSTMTLGLLRILELSENDQGNLGKLIIDDEDISKLGLHVLRRNVVIIPQDPVLFSGTVKNNIDPFDEFSDQNIKDALRKVNIWGSLTAEGLEMKVLDGGSNFSLGQRQLFCIARALIKKPKVLIMDEATASIDEKTDHIIQKLIIDEFKETTVLTIAHRLNTIIQYDRILVLENGYLIEYDTPINLINQGKGLFSSLIKEYGKDFEAKMKFLAENKDRKTEGNESCEIIPNEIEMKVFVKIGKEKNGGKKHDRLRKKIGLMALDDGLSFQGYVDDRMSEVSIFQKFEK